MNNTINELLTFSTVSNNSNSVSNPVYYLPEPLRNVMGYNLQNFCGINNFYTIDARNNAFSWTENGKATITVFISYRNYTITTLLAEIQALMNANTLSANVYSLSVITPTNGIINVINILATGTATSFILNNTSNNCYYELGITKFDNIYSFSVNGNSQFDLTGVTQIYLVSADLDKHCRLLNNNNPIIGSIPVNSGYLSPIIYNNNNDNFVSCEQNQIQSISFRLLDQRGRLLTQVSDWSISILFSTN